MRKPSNTLLEAMDQMEQIPGIAGAWSEVRCQTHHTKPMRKTDWAFITSSGWLYVNTEREASCPEWVYILSHCCLHLALGHCDVTRSVSKMTEIERRGGKRWDKPKKAEKSRDCGGGKF